MGKINIADLLRNCPKGMELDCTIYNDVTFNRLQGNEYIIINRGYNGGEVHLTKFGQMYNSNDAKCVIFPKGKTTWEGFHRPFKDGDIIYVYKDNVNEDFYYKYIAIFKEIKNNCIYVHGLYSYNDKVFSIHPCLCEIKDSTKIKFATEEEKQQLFYAIKANGYKWNAETKTLEKLVESKEDNKTVIAAICFNREDYADNVELNLGDYEIKTRKDKTYAVLKNAETKTLEELIKPKFKVGDRIKHKNDEHIITVTGIKNNCYFISYFNTITNKYQNAGVSIEKQDDYELILNKFDITTLIPFESKVLVRDENTEEWRGHFFSHYDSDSDRPYICIGANVISEYKQCIPYEGNEHLLGTTNDCDDFYKI